MDGRGGQVARVSPCATLQTQVLPCGGGHRALLSVGQGPPPHPWPLEVSLLLSSALLFPERQLHPRDCPLPTLGTGRGSTSPCPAGSGAARRPGPRPGSAGPPGPPAGPAPSTVCAEQPFSPSGRLGPGASGAGRVRQASGTHRGHWGDPYLWAWLGFHPGPKDSPLEARDAGVGA